MDLYLFNPDNDLALANNNENYRSPASARKMGTDLAPLMGWLAEDGDGLLYPAETLLPLPAPPYPQIGTYTLSSLAEEFSKDRKRWINRQKVALNTPQSATLKGEKWHFKTERFQNAVTSQLYPENQLLKPARIIPWGWNPSLVRQLSGAGLSTDLLPSPSTLQYIKQTSHRSVAVRLLKEFLSRLPEEEATFFCGASKEVTSEEELKHLICTTTYPLLLKAPLSGSGRGLIRAEGRYISPVSGWCKNTLLAQGSVIVEPLYNKVCDFAMEFMAKKDGTILFKGLSLFETNVHGSYTCNRLMTDKQICTFLCCYKGITDALLKKLQLRIRKLLEEIIDSRYSGFMGVDMMICMDNQGCYRIHPCVEVNARFTMGLLSRLFYDRYITPGSTGVFQIRFSKKKGELQKYVEKETAATPLHYEEGRFSKGYLPLTPVNTYTQFLAEVRLVPSATPHQV